MDYLNGLAEIIANTVQALQIQPITGHELITSITASIAATTLTTTTAMATNRITQAVKNIRARKQAKRNSPGPRHRQGHGRHTK